MLRRVRSGYSIDIELVSNVNIRSHYKLVNEDNVSLTVIGENPNTLTRQRKKTRRKLGETLDYSF